MEDIEKTTVLIRNTIRDFPNRYHENNKRIKEIEEETMDLLHLIELTTFNAAEGYKIAKRIKEIRQERRRLKDENEQLKHIEPILTKWRDRLQQLDKVVGDIRKAKMNKVNRSYRCRVRKDLQSKINGVKQNV